MAGSAAGSVLPERMRHADYIEAVAGLPAPAHLRAMMVWLAGQEQLAIVEPQARAGLHPLLVPLARSDEGTMALLRWPTPPKGLPMPLVLCGEHIRLLSLSVDQWLHRQLARRDAAGLSLGGLGRVCEDLYVQGMLEASSLPLTAYVLLKVGGQPDLYEELASAHLDGGDELAALVTADRATTAIAGWGQPLVFRMRLLAQLGREEAAKEAAKVALLEPVWTFGGPFAPVAEMAGWSQISSAPYRRLVDDAELPLDRAAHLMDALAVEQGDWDGAREELAGCYRQAGLAELAAFVSSA